MNHRTWIVCQLSYRVRRLARVASISYFALPLVSPGSPLSPASLGWIIYLVLCFRQTHSSHCMQYASLYTLSVVYKPSFSQNNESTVIFAVKYTFHIICICINIHIYNTCTYIIHTHTHIGLWRNPAVLHDDEGGMRSPLPFKRTLYIL